MCILNDIQILSLTFVDNVIRFYNAQCLQYFSNHMKLRSGKLPCAMKNIKKMNFKKELPDSSEVRNTLHSNSGRTCCTTENVFKVININGNIHP